MKLAICDIKKKRAHIKVKLEFFLLLSSANTLIAEHSCTKKWVN